jgi:hypothetical protein
LVQILQLFDQNNITNDKHLLYISEEQVPEKHLTVVRRLREAIANPEIM